MLAQTWLAIGATERLAQAAGGVLASMALADIFLTVLYARSGSALLSERVNPMLWRVFRQVARYLPRRSRNLFLSFFGPVVMVLTILIWVGMLILGFALIVWPELGTSVQASSGTAPSDFATALYYSGANLTTMGSADLLPMTPFFRALAVTESLVGISIITLVLAYLVQIYQALQSRNTLALELHFGTRGTGDAAEFLAGLGPHDDFDGARAEFSRLARGLLSLYESHHLHPALLYFRFIEARYALSRTALVLMDCVSLLQSALDDRAHAPLKESGAMAELWGGGMHLLTELSRVFLPKHLVQPGRSPDEQTRGRWQHRYQTALTRLRAAGITLVRDERAGAEQYIELRRQWDAYIAGFADYMGHNLDDIDPVLAGH